MNRITTTATCVLAFCCSDAVYAQQGAEGGGAGPGLGRMYDPKTVETINGEVASVEQMTPTKGTGYGVHLTLKTDKETVSVHLGPSWYIETQKIEILPKDRITVKGSRIAFDGKPAIIAAEIIKGDTVLKLRNDNGIPAWAGGKRRTIP